MHVCARQRLKDARNSPEMNRRAAGFSESRRKDTHRHEPPSEKTRAVRSDAQTQPLMLLRRSSCGSAEL